MFNVLCKCMYLDRADIWSSSKKFPLSLLGILVYNFASTCFTYSHQHNSGGRGVCWIWICRIIFYICCPSPSKKQNNKWLPKWFMVSVWFGIEKLIPVDFGYFVVKCYVWTFFFIWYKPYVDWLNRPATTDIHTTLPLYIPWWLFFSRNNQVNLLSPNAYIWIIIC